MSTFQDAPPVKIADQSGNGITSTTVSGKQALDVNLPAGSVTVVLPDDTSNIAALSNLASTTGTQLALSANASRKGFFLYNDSTANCFLAWAATSSTSAYTIRLDPKGYYRDDKPFWLGSVSAIWDAADGFLRITELT